MRDVQGVQLATSGGFGDRLAGGIVGDMVAIDDVVVPVSLTLLQGCTLEPESSLPATGLSRVLVQRKLSIVVVPRSKKMDCLAVRRSAECEVELDCCHFGDYVLSLTCFENR